MMKKTVALVFFAALTAGVIAAPAPAMQWNFEEGKPDIPPAAILNAVTQPGPGSQIVDGKNKTKALASLGTGKDRDNVGGALVKRINFDFTKPFSIEILMKLNADAGYRDFKDIIGCCDGERGPGFRVSIFYNKILLRSGDGKTVRDIASNPALCGLKPDTWQLVTVTYDGKEGAIYLDGVEVAREAWQIAPAKCRDLSIGCFRIGYAYPLQGAIDYVELYDKTLTAEEVAETYLAEFGE